MYTLSDGSVDGECPEQGQDCVESKNTCATAVRESEEGCARKRKRPLGSLPLSRPPKRQASLRASKRLEAYANGQEVPPHNVSDDEGSRGRATNSLPEPLSFPSRLAAIAHTNSRKGKNVKALTMSAWLTGAVGKALASHAPSLKAEELSGEVRLEVGQAVLEQVVAYMKSTRPAFWTKAVRNKSQASRLRHVRDAVRKMVGGFLRVRLGTRAAEPEVLPSEPRFYVDSVPGFGLGLRLRPLASMDLSGLIPELTESSWLSNERPRHVRHRSAVEKGGTRYELVGPAALLNAGCELHVSIHPGDDFVSFAGVPLSDLTPHAHVLMSYGMDKVDFVCWCKQPIV